MQLPLQNFRKNVHKSLIHMEAASPKMRNRHFGVELGWPATLTHCAQSIQFALSGYPQAKSELFQRTVGRAAYQVFAWRGQMSHDLSEPIPGAPALRPQADPQAALAELHQAIEAFHRHTGELQPHFAYGRLSKAEYELAHAMHLANHLAAFDISPAA